MFKIICLLVVLPIFAHGLELLPCLNGEPLPEALFVQGCTQAPCVLVNGQTVVSSVIFTATRNSNTLTNRATIIFGDLEVPIDIIPDDQRNACLHLASASCPVRAMQRYTSRVNAPVDAPVTNVDVTLRFQLADDTNEPLFCYLLAVRVIPA